MFAADARNPTGRSRPVTPEADLFLQKAKKHPERGHTMLSVNLNDDARRATYLAVKT